MNKTTLPTNLIGVFENIPETDKAKIITGWGAPRSIVSFRVNHLKSSRGEVVKSLDESSLPYTVWEFWDDAFFMDKEHEYTLRGLDIYKEGKIYVQSLSSMIPALGLDLQPGQKILDMTAAPGSKTTQIASMLSGNCTIIALEKFGIRLEKLVHTIKLQGAEKCVEVMKIDATDLVSHFSKDSFGNKGEKMFDRILLDVPCSSDGRINLADEKTHRWYSGEKSHTKSQLQYEMLEQARKMLALGGRIVYSTCSVSRRENEDVIQKFLKTHPDFHLIASPVPADYTLEEGMNRWYPSTMMEGFFVAILERA